MAILDKVNFPTDIEELSDNELIQLSEEIRNYIIDTVSKTGGHLAPSLGVVELTVALLKVFKPPIDKIIWDVSHQTYAYKILTGRKDKLKTIRQLGGISGFLKREESEYDVWGAGHASTAISAALGFATKRDLVGGNYNVTAVIGDGSLTGGIAFEGLNNAGCSGKNILIILNDNAMSISPNVGALAKYLTKFVASPFYQKVKSQIWEATGKIGGVGSRMRVLARKLEDSFKNLVVPGMFFEQLGFDYYGPVNGHDIHELTSILEEIKDVKKPKLLHVVTIKGKGFKPAEKDATTYHGLGKFDPNTGELFKTTGSHLYTNVFGNAMIELGKKFPDLCAITAAMSTGTGLDLFSEKYTDRFFDVGIAESHAVLFGGALAVEDRRTVVAIYSTFLQRAYDIIIHDITLQKVPLVLALDRAGIVGEDGPTHHGAFDISYLRSIPGMVVTAPKDGQELRNLLFTALHRFSEPWAIRYPRGLVPDKVTDSFNEIPFSSWEIIIEGDGNLLVLAVGSMVYPAIEAAQSISQFKPSVVNCRFIKPFDKKLLEDLLKTHKNVLIIEEGSELGGFGEGVSAYAMSKGLKHRIIIRGIPDKFIQHGTRAQLLSILGLDVSGIKASMEKFWVSNQK